MPTIDPTCPSRCLATRSLRSAAPAAAASFTLAAVFFIVANTATPQNFCPDPWPGDARAGRSRAIRLPGGRHPHPRQLALFYLPMLEHHHRRIQL